jgi:hypothetical protein
LTKTKEAYRIKGQQKTFQQGSGRGVRSHVTFNLASLA